MKKLSTVWSHEQMAFMCEYLKQAYTWDEAYLNQDTEMHPTQKVLMIATGSILRKMAISYATRLVEGRNTYNITLSDGKVEALYSFFAIENCPFPYRIRNEILVELEPLFPFQIDESLFNNVNDKP